MLAGLARGRMRVKHAALVQALTGRFDEHHAELARILPGQYDALTTQIDALTTRIESLVAAIPAARGVDADATTGPGAGASSDAAVLATIDRLDQIPGIARHTAQVIIAEAGLGMSRFPAAGHLVSWAKLSPRTIQSGPKNRSGKTGRGNPYLKGGLGEAATAAAKTDTFLGERYRRIVKRRGKLKALVAIARSILVTTCSHRPRRPLLRPRFRLLRQPHRQRPQDPQSHPPARSARLHRHPHPGRLTRSFTRIRLRRMLPRARLRSLFSVQRSAVRARLAPQEVPGQGMI